MPIFLRVNASIFSFRIANYPGNRSNYALVYDEDNTFSFLYMG